MGIEAIRAVIADTERLQSDAEGFSRLLTEDAVLVNFGGRRVLGRDNVRRAMEEALKTPFAQVYTSVEIVDVRFPRSDLAVVSCVKRISDERESAAREGDAPLSESGSQTFVLVRDEDAWLIAVAQTTPIVV